MGDPRRPSYVALFDILGFRSLVQRSAIHDLRATMDRMRSATSKRLKRSRMGVQVIRYSDSILFYTEGTRKEQMINITVASAAFIAECLADGIPVRGGITRADEEEFFADGDMYFGKGMVRAYDLEQAQDWAGGIWDPEMIPTSHYGGSHHESATLQDLRDATFLVRYAAPIKGGSIGAIDCLNWPTFLEVEESKFNELFGQRNPSKDWDVLRKRANTSAFLEHCLRPDAAE